MELKAQLATLDLKIEVALAGEKAKAIREIQARMIEWRIRRRIFRTTPHANATKPAAKAMYKLLVLIPPTAGRSGFGAAAAPCSIVSAGLKVIPLVGHVAAAPTDACAAVID
jgi:hypothetical protein